MAGRKSVISIAVLHKLEEAFVLGCSDQEACLYANIALSTMYKYQHENYAFSERKQLLKMNPVLLARKTVIDSFRRNPHLAFKYLERKCPEEFGLRKEILVTNADVSVALDLLELETDYDEFAKDVSQQTNAALQSN